MPQLGIVYVITNPAMPGLVKIGRTAYEDAKMRMKELFSTGVPMEFQLAYACKVVETEKVEKALHIAFAPNRVHLKREFFQIDPGQAIAILQLLHTEEVTIEVATLTGIDGPTTSDGDEQFGQRRPNLNFQEMQIPVGSTLDSVVEATANSTVIGPRKVNFQGADMSLTAATRKVLGLPYSVAPGPYWKFNGSLIRDIYNETYPVQE